MKKMKLTIVLLLVTFAVAFCQPDKVFKEQITVEKGIKYGDGTIQLTAGGGGSIVYPSAGIPVSTGTAWGTSIMNNSANWNTAFGWGNHAGLYSLLNHNHSTLYKPISYTPTWAEITGKPTVFNPDLSVTNPLYKAITWKPDYNTDILNKPGEIELAAAISSLPFFSPPKKTTAEILVITPTPTNGDIVFDKTLNVWKGYVNGVWKIFPTTN